MRAQLDDVHARGEPIAVLLRVRGRHLRPFRLRALAFLGEIDFEGGRSTFIRGYRPVGSVRLLPRSEALPAMRAIYDRAQPRRPGMIAMEDTWWEWLFFEKESEKDEPTFYAVHETDGEPDAYATYRVKHEWPDSIPKLELTVRQLVAATRDAYADIWRYLFDVDLVHRVKAWNRPVDEPLSYLMEEPRRLRFRIADGLRVRLVDVPAALEARGFVGDGRVVVEVEDRFCPWNEGRVCDRGRPPELRAAPVRTTSLISLAARPIWARPTWEGRRSGSSTGPVASTRSGLGALERVDAMFATDPAPWSPFIF